MNPLNLVIKRFPRIAKVMMAISEETDVDQTAAILAHAIRSRKRGESNMATALVREAWLNRHQYKRTLEATRAIDLIIYTGELHSDLPQMTNVV